jgi:hypothetical protein
MKRLFCGSVVFAASLVLVSCSNDPTSDFRGTPTRIVADPSSIFLDQGDNASVIVRLEDDQGDPLPADWQVAAGSGITVDRNEDFLPTTVGAPLESEAQFDVFAGNAPLATSFTVSGGGLDLEIPVKVTPTDLASAVFSNPAPAANEPVTITAEGFGFLPEAVVSFAGDTAITLSNDGTALTFLPTPGTTGPALVEGVAINFLPEAPLSLETTAEITVGAAPEIPGTGDPATAPSLVVPPEGGTTGLFDAPDFVATIDHFYKLTVTEEGVYTVTMNWTAGSDLDLILCDAALAACDGQAATGNQPEVGVYALVPGTYFVIAEDFGEDAAGATVGLAVRHDPPAAELRTPAPARKQKVRK